MLTKMSMKQIEKAVQRRLRRNNLCFGVTITRVLNISALSDVSIMESMYRLSNLRVEEQ